MKIFIFSLIASAALVAGVNISVFEGTVTGVIRSVFYFTFPTAILMGIVLIIFGYAGGLFRNIPAKTYSAASESEMTQLSKPNVA